MRWGWEPAAALGFMRPLGPLILSMGPQEEEPLGRP